MSHTPKVIKQTRRDLLKLVAQIKTAVKTAERKSFFPPWRGLNK